MVHEKKIYIHTQQIFLLNKTSMTKIRIVENLITVGSLEARMKTELRPSKKC